MTTKNQAENRNAVGRPLAEPTKPAMIRLTELQRAKFLELGGARWVKRLIDEANTPSSMPKS